jgi:D-threo-aldose 1-dehydrogenase
LTRVAALGRGGLQAGRFSFGGAPLGGLFHPVDERQAEECLEAAWSAGLRYFDTAPHYGAGLSERRIGRFLAGKPSNEWVLSTKVGRLIEPAAAADADHAGFAGEQPSHRVFDFSRDGLVRSLEASLERLGVDHVDIVFLHDPDDHWPQAIDEAWPALAKLRDEGVVTSIGAGMKQSPMLARFVRETDMDVVLLAGRYTLLDQTALADLLPACVERQVSVVLGGVFNSGVLANPSAGSTFEYEAVHSDVLARVRRIADVCSRHEVSMAAAALQFPLAHPSISTVCVGARSAEEVRQNVELAGTSLPTGLWEDLRAEGLLSADAPVPAGSA